MPRVADAAAALTCASSSSGGFVRRVGPRLGVGQGPPGSIPEPGGAAAPGSTGCPPPTPARTASPPACGGPSSCGIRRRAQPGGVALARGAHGRRARAARGHRPGRGRWIGRVIGDLERGPAPGAQHPPELAHIAEGDRRIGNVLEHDDRHAGVDARAASDRPARRPSPSTQRTLSSPRVQLAGPGAASRRRRRGRAPGGRGAASTRVIRPRPQPISSTSSLGVEPRPRGRRGSSRPAPRRPRSARVGGAGRAGGCRRSRTRPRGRGRSRSARISSGPHRPIGCRRVPGPAPAAACQQRALEPAPAGQRQRRSSARRARRGVEREARPACRAGHGTSAGVTSSAAITGCSR